MWYRQGGYAEDEVRCDYVLEPATSVFDFDFYVFPEHRMGLAFVALWNGVNAHLAERGVRHTFSRMTRFNVASRRAHQHLGARVVSKAVVVRLWSVEALLTTQAPYLQVGIRSQARARLVLRARSSHD